MAPKFCGNKYTDHIEAINLATESFKFTRRSIKTKGFFCVKIIKGPKEKILRQKMKKYFKQTMYFKPDSSRKVSSEIYLIGIKYRY
jgi:23S rRNA (uridine2552-2'-O)-methyltransferase